MAKMYAHDDDSVVVVIGSGAGGGTVANELAQKGIDVICLEAGSRLTLGGRGHGCKRTRAEGN
jgi:choline dehydrogenase-like flavoprotein